MSRFSSFSRSGSGPQSSSNSRQSRPFNKSYDTRRPQPVAEVLNRTDAYAALRAGVEQIAALEADLKQLLPDYLATSVEPGFIKDGVLALFAGHNALAARLRQIEPRLLSELQQRGWPVTSLRIRVRPQAVKEPPPIKQARMTAAGAGALQALSESLAPSPLREALAKMAARHLRKR
ncbi:DciA family protein [Paraburkholderia sp.]|uniref:DciA family protein n=1 Tax=Paraburkholderia sp. TaxID=1926495 RepID=UPI002395174D|nr:DciA family protein [Paraburkholderia sp.]MDE1183209.1 DciA family protein [Paraburkholderia sp.]